MSENPRPLFAEVDARHWCDELLRGARISVFISLLPGYVPEKEKVRRSCGHVAREVQLRRQTGVPWTPFVIRVTCLRAAGVTLRIPSFICFGICIPNVFSNVTDHTLCGADTNTGLFKC